MLSPFADVVGRYIEVAVKNRICQLETSQKQQETQIGQLSKEVQSLQNLKDEESQLKQEMYKVLEQLQTQVQINTDTIKSLEYKLDEFIPPSVSKSGNDEDILARVIALEEQVRTNTEACSEMRQRINLEDRLKNCEKLIGKHYEQIHKQMSDLSIKLSSLEKQKATGQEKSRKKPSKSWRPWAKKASKAKESSDSSDLAVSSSPELKHTSSDITLTVMGERESPLLHKKSGSRASLDELI